MKSTDNKKPRFKVGVFLLTTICEKRYKAKSFF